MKTVLKGLTTAVILAAAVTAPASAQVKTWGFGVHGAYFKSGTLARGGDETRLQMDNNGAFGGNLEYWFAGSRLGLRANMDYAKTPWILDNDDFQDGIDIDNDPVVINPLFDDDQQILNGFGDVAVWMGDLNLAWRFLTPTVDRKFAPFLSVGGGFVNWDQQTEGTPIDLRILVADAQIQGNSQSEFAFTGSLGTDFFFSDNVALRLEAKDYWNPSSPYMRISELGESVDADGSRHHDGTQNILWQAGLSFQFGGRRVPEPGFIAEAPPPPPPPAPAPPRPTTEQVAMCIVNQNGQLEMVNATRDLGTREITVMRNGQRVAFMTAYPANQPYYIQGAPWYVASRPLVVDLTGKPSQVEDKLDRAVELPENRIELVNFGSTGPMPTGDVLYIGSVDGTPLYAKRTDISNDLLPDLQAKLRTSSDLEDILHDDTAFADRFANGISTIYLAVAPAENACVYQPVSSTRVVRRTRG